MREQTTPWIELAGIRRKKKLLQDQLAVLDVQEIELRGACQVWLGSLPSDLLSRRETEVLLLLQANPTFSNKELAQRLEVTERTIKFHVSALLKKYKVTKRFELVHVNTGVPK